MAADALRADTLVLDAVYEPERTRLLRDAEARGAAPISGRWMLVHQAAEQLRLWTGATPRSTSWTRRSTPARGDERSQRRSSR